MIVPKLDENGRFETCPRCENHDFSNHARFCKMCGLMLYNECSAVYEHNDYYDCGKNNPADARHCEHCGSTTYLYNQELLLSWDKVIKSSPESNLKVVGKSNRNK